MLITMTATAILAECLAALAVLGAGGGRGLSFFMAQGAGCVAMLLAAALVNMRSHSNETGRVGGQFTSNEA